MEATIRIPWAASTNYPCFMVQLCHYHGPKPNHLMIDYNLLNLYTKKDFKVIIYPVIPNLDHVLGI